MPRTRDRLERVRLADAGWSIPKIARHSGRCQMSVRRWIKAYREGGFDALVDQPHVGQASALTPDLQAAVRSEIGRGERPWSAQQIADWLAKEHNVHLSSDWLGRLLRRAKLSYKRTGRNLKHKQDPLQVAAKSAELETLKKGAMPDR